MTNLAGTAKDTCTGLPFGDGINCVGTEWNFNRFTDYVHDSESNLEHTPSRQYSSTQGRFLSPDPSFASIDLGNPQSINRYPYVGGNPVNFTDPLGLQRVCTLMAGTGDEVSFCINIGPDMVDGQSLQDPFGAGSGGFGGGIGDIIGRFSEAAVSPAILSQAPASCPAPVRAFPYQVFWISCRTFRNLVAILGHAATDCLAH